MGEDEEVGIELRRGFLSYRHEDIGTFQVGIQDWSDSFWDTLASGDWDFNVGGIHFSRSLTSLGEAELGLGAFKMWEGDVTKDRDESNLFVADIDFPVRDESTVGVSLYYVYDNDEYSYPDDAEVEITYPVGPYSSSWDYWLGLRGKTVCRSVPLEAFIIFNEGEMEDPDWDHNRFALGAWGNYDLGWGTFSMQGLYSTGDDDPGDDDSDEFRTVAQSVRDNFGAQGYWSYLSLTSPHGPSDVNDLGVSLQNRGLGLITLQGKLEFPITENLSGYTAVGWFRSDEDRPTSDDKDMGTEVMAQATYDFGHGLKLDFGGAYFFTEDFYRAAADGDSPDDLYELFARMQLEF